jgi:GntR family transcriptional regulator/MocR family aminotransferase
LDKTGRVIYVGSFSKTLLPTLRLGFIVTPSSCTAAVHRAKYVTDWHTSMLAQAALARFMNDGSFARHIRKINRVYRERHEVVKNAIIKDFADHLELIPSVAGLHMAALSRSASSEEIDRILQRAAERSVAVQSLSRFAVDAIKRSGLVIGYGAIATADIHEGLGRLRECFDDETKARIKRGSYPRH